MQLPGQTKVQAAESVQIFEFNRKQGKGNEIKEGGA